MMRSIGCVAVLALATIFGGQAAMAQDAAPAPDLQTALCADFNGASDATPYVNYVEGFANARAGGSDPNAGAHVEAVRQACLAQPEVGFLSMVAATAPAPLAAVGTNAGPTSCSAPPTSACPGCAVSCSAGQQAVCKAGRNFGAARCATRARCSCE
jgi:hypothetical protein